MSNPVCTNATLISTSACYRTGSISVFQQKALLIHAKVLQLAAIGGADYTAQLVGTLLSATACPPIEPDDVRAANIAIAYANAAAAGASVPSTIQTKIAAVNCLQNVPGGLHQLDQIDMYLNCALGRHAAYPQ